MKLPELYLDKSSTIFKYYPQFERIDLLSSMICIVYHLWKFGITLYITKKN